MFQSAAAEVTSSYYPALTAIRDRIADITAWIAVWWISSEPDEQARRCASDAVEAIDATIRDLHAIRARRLRAH